jgi:hypothetical protein
MARDIVQSLWMGSKLSEMERLSMRSFLANGHPFHLYVYDYDHAPYVGMVPDGVEVKDAEEIIPWRESFTVRGGYSSFSDFFRWKLVRDRGGWWADTDTVCLRPFDFPGEYAFVGGMGPVGADDCVSSGMFRAPAHSPITEWAWGECQKMDPSTMPWGEAGPPLITRAVHKFSLTKHLISARLFFPVFYTGAPAIFTNAVAPVIPKEAYSIHLFHEMWRLAGADKNREYPATSLYEQLKRRFA